MSFPRYPKYKESGVGWLGIIPEHWKSTYLKWNVKGFKSGGTPETGNGAYWADTDADGIPWVAIGDMTRGRIVTSTDRCVTKTGLASKGLELLPVGTLLYSMYASLGKVAELGVSAVINQAILGIIPDPAKTSQGYLKYWLNHLEQFLSIFSSSSTQDNINAAKVRSFPIFEPTLEEQAAIADFLDRETEKIDALAAAQLKLIELLKEKRQAIMSHAVTKGLNPDAPMKDSGIEWLGEIPAFWSVKRFQRSVFIAEGQVDPEEEEFSDLPLIAPNHIESGTGKLLSYETAKEQGAISGKYLCKKGDVVYSKIRPALRKVCMANIDCLCSADMYPLRAHSGLTNDFLFWVILSESFSSFAVLESDRVAMPKINRESLKAVKIAVPPIEEQMHICSYLSSQTKLFDALISEALKAITLLQERRSALISAAVTGQIDVRTRNLN